jgi:hypothetical protein
MGGRSEMKAPGKDRNGKVRIWGVKRKDRGGGFEKG